MNKIILIFFFFLTHNLSAQLKHDYIWLYGYDFDLGIPGGDGANINFNTNPVSTEYESRDMNIYVSNASICDIDGNLLFYTNGCYVADATHAMMENGDGLNPGEPHDNNCNNGYAIPQGVIILPTPGSENTYYIFHKASTYMTEPVFNILDTLFYYTKVDMVGNNGLGKVVKKNQLILEDTLSQGQLTAVKHANNQDWWIMVNEYLTDRYYTLLFTEFGVQDTVVQTIGEQGVIYGEGGGQAVFSPDGTKYVRYTPADGVFLFDFDRSTGLLSDFINIPIEDDAFTGGVAISPNSRYLYISAQFFIYQFDLEAENIADSKIIVAEYDGFFAPFPSTFYQAQLGPDCRIYINSANGIDVLHTINYPDNPGLACEVAQHSIQLPTNHQISMPNFPNYRLGVGPVCDTSFILTATEQVLYTTDSPFTIYPNPADDQVNLNILLPSGKKGVWSLYTALGELVISEPLFPYQETYMVDLEKIESGLYFYKVEVDGVNTASGKLVVE